MRAAPQTDPGMAREHPAPLDDAPADARPALRPSSPRPVASALRRTFAVLALLSLIPFGYLVYCIATLPFGGGVSPDPGTSAQVIEANSGSVFATRGVFR